MHHHCYLCWIEILENAIYFEGSQLEKVGCPQSIFSRPWDILSETVAHALGSKLQHYRCKVCNTGLVICENTPTKQEISHWISSQLILYGLVAHLTGVNNYITWHLWNRKVFLEDFQADEQKGFCFFFTCLWRANVLCSNFPYQGILHYL